MAIHADALPFTIVTPSYNQAATLGQTIHSVLSQDVDAPVRYHVMDGGSTDGSRDIVEKHAPRLAGWACEKDRGQSHAINKGFDRARADHGDAPAIHAYLNSDDFYLPGALAAVAEAFRANPDAGIVHGFCRIVDEQGRMIGRHRGAITSFEEGLDVWRFWWSRKQLVQPEVFWSSALHRQVGPFREDLHYVMDFEFWLRLLRAGARVVPIDHETTAFRRTPDQKSAASSKVAAEILDNVLRPLLDDPATPVAPALRRRLLARLDLQRGYQLAVADAARRGESRPRRALRAAAFLARRPRVLADPVFLDRLERNVLSPLPAPTPGRIRARLAHGPRVAWMRDVVRPRILAAPPRPVDADGPAEIHVLTSRHDWLNLLWALHSFYRVSDRALPLCIHDDGSLPREGAEALLRHFPGARLVPREEADREVLPRLDAHPRAQRFRADYTLALKVLDFRHHLRAPKLLLVDSDVLFFRRPDALLDRALDDAWRGCALNRDPQTMYTVDPGEAGRALGFAVLERVNSGLGVLVPGALDVDAVERYLALPGILGHFWRIEQTLYALGASAHAGEHLPPDYDVYLDEREPLGQRPSRHYVGAIRHLMYGEGIARLRGELLR